MNSKLLLAFLGFGLMGSGAIFGQSTGGKVPEGMALIPAGEFWMGSPEKVGSTDEHPRHKVYLDSFYIDENLVTNRMFQDFVKATGYKTEAEKNGGGFLFFVKDKGSMRVATANWKDPRGDGEGIHKKMDHPVVQVTWNDAQAYAKWAGKRLPTEAEYEKAARGGKDTQYFFGDVPTPLRDYSWFNEKYAPIYEGSTHPVGMKKPNPYGLFDVYGNVSEWCSDWYGDEYYAKSPRKNPKGPTKGEGHITRGGPWFDSAKFLGSALRARRNPQDRLDSMGFRCVKDMK